MNKLDKRITEETLRNQSPDCRYEIKSDIASQTKWILTVVMAAASIISVIQPVIMKILKIT
jgi:hypothetical protein